MIAIIFLYRLSSSLRFTFNDQIFVWVNCPQIISPYPPVSLSGLEHTKPRTTPIWFSASSNFSYSLPIHKFDRTPSIYTNSSFNPSFPASRFVLIACACGIVLIVLWYCMPARGDRIAALKFFTHFLVFLEKELNLFYLYIQPESDINIP